MSVDLNGKTVFLSGPMSGIKNMNVEVFAAAHHIVRNLGARAVYNPAIEYLTTDPEYGDRTHEQWMAQCIHEITKMEYNGHLAGYLNVSGNRSYLYRPKYDVLISLPNWHDSDGACIERRVAQACGIECYNLNEITDAK